MARAHQAKVVGAAHQDAIIVAAALVEEAAQPGGAGAEHHLHGGRQRRAHRRPVVVARRQREQRHRVPVGHERAQDGQRARIAGAELLVGNPIVDDEDAQPAGRTRARAQRIALGLVGQPLTVGGDEASAALGLHAQRRLGRRRAGELEVLDDGVGVVDHAPALLPQAHTVVDLLVVGGAVAFVEATELDEQRSRREEERPRAEVHIALKAVGPEVGGLASAVAEARAVAPDDAARLLQPAIRQEQPRADRADVRGAFHHAQRRGHAAGQRRGVMVEDEEVGAAGQPRGAVDGGGEAGVGGGALEARSVDAIEERGGFVGRSVVDDDHLEPRGRRGFEGAQAAEQQLGAIVGDDQDRDDRRAGGGQPQALRRGEEPRQLRAGGARQLLLGQEQRTRDDRPAQLRPVIGELAEPDPRRARQAPLAQRAPGLDCCSAKKISRRRSRRRRRGAHHLHRERAHPLAARQIGPQLQRERPRVVAGERDRELEAAAAHVGAGQLVGDDHVGGAAPFEQQRLDRGLVASQPAAHQELRRADDAAGPRPLDRAGEPGGLSRDHAGHHSARRRVWPGVGARAPRASCWKAAASSAIRPRRAARYRGDPSRAGGPSTHLGSRHPRYSS